MIKWLLNILFPLECLGCRTAGCWICPACLASLPPYRPGAGSTLLIPGLDRLHVVGDYRHPLLAALIKRFKYGLVSELASGLGKLLLDYCLSCPREERIFFMQAGIVPLPLAQQRLRWRGFNQAGLLAENLAGGLRRPLSTALRRRGRRPPQASLSKRDRLENVQDAFFWSGGPLTGKKILLIDDVVTTGATLAAAARVLRSAGAGEVQALVLAAD